MSFFWQRSNRGWSPVEREKFCIFSVRLYVHTFSYGWFSDLPGWPHIFFWPASDLQQAFRLFSADLMVWGPVSRFEGQLSGLRVSQQVWGLSSRFWGPARGGADGRIDGCTKYNLPLMWSWGFTLGVDVTKNWLESANSNLKPTWQRFGKSADILWEVNMKKN